MFRSPKYSLAGLLGEAYTDRVCEAAAFFGNAGAMSAARREVDFYPEAYQASLAEKLPLVGTRVCAPLETENAGMAAQAFADALHRGMSPLSAAGYYRIGEDGRLYLIGKSEHYHASLGHAFPGYGLIGCARELGIPNATHNNTRGYITRLCEKRLAEATGTARRVINLETGSLAVEAGVKEMLSRFYKLDDSKKAPLYSGKVPVFLVMADENGGPEANYHGTTVLTQLMRGLWPELARGMERAGLYRVVPVRPNDIADFREKLETFNRAPYKTAGFLHELILMNYGGVRLSEEYVQEAYTLCRETDTATLCDEIQTGMWYDGMYLHRAYGVVPDMVVVGKGFPGGEYPASKLLVTPEYDRLNQFGALVTNGQEELASLAYLVTMTFVEANGAEIARLGARFEASMRELAAAYPQLVRRAEGRGHLAALHFGDVKTALGFAGKLGARAIDASAQAYKVHCPPAVLLKPPVTADERALDAIADACRAALEEMQ